MGILANHLQNNFSILHQFSTYFNIINRSLFTPKKYFGDGGTTRPHQKTKQPNLAKLNFPWNRSKIFKKNKQYQTDPNWPKLPERIKPWEPNYFGGGSLLNHLLFRPSTFGQRNLNRPLPNKLFWGWGTTRQPQKINSLTMPNLAKLTSPWIVQTYYIEPNWIQIDPNCIQIASKRQTLRITMNYLLNYLFFRASTYHRLLGKETWIGSFLPK